MNDNSLKDIKQQLIRLRTKEISGGLDEMEKKKKKILQAKFEKLKESLNIERYAQALNHKKDMIAEHEYNRLLLNGYKPEDIEKMIKEGTWKDTLKKPEKVSKKKKVVKKNDTN